MKTRLAFLVVIGMALALAVPAQKKTAEQKAPVIETFTGFAVQVTSGQAGVLEMVINRWSTDGERQLLENVIKAQGSAAAVNAMQDLPQVGYIRGNNTMGDALFYARSTNLPDGTRRVVIATNRPLTVAQMVAPDASNQYDATVIEMHFPKGGGKGTGKVVVGGKASIDPKTGQLLLKNWSGEPVRLENITSKTS